MDFRRVERRLEAGPGARLAGIACKESKHGLVVCEGRIGNDRAGRSGGFQRWEGAYFAWHRAIAADNMAVGEQGSEYSSQPCFKSLSLIPRQAFDEGLPP